jgi:integrase
MASKRGNGEGSIYVRDDGRWYGAITLGITVEGRPKRKTVSGKTRTEVVKKLGLLQRQRDDGLPIPDTALTVKVLLDRWFEDILKRTVTLSTSSNYRSIAVHHLIPNLGSRRLNDLTVAELDRLWAKKLEEGMSTSSVRRMRYVLSQAISQGIRWGVVNRNVAQLSRAPRIVRQEGRTLTPEQARMFLTTLKGNRLETLFTLMLVTGMRRGEALGLQWKDFDGDKGVLLVRRQLKREGGRIIVSDTKTAKSRRAVNLPSQLLELLQSHRTRQCDDRERAGIAWMQNDFIFTTSYGTPFDPRNMLRDFKNACVDAGLGDWHLHELRHSAASLMLAKGVKLQVVSEVLGHSSIRMTADVYGHILEPDRQAAANAMGEALWTDSIDKKS